MRKIFWFSLVFFTCLLASDNFKAKITTLNLSFSQDEKQTMCNFVAEVKVEFEESYNRTIITIGGHKKEVVNLAKEKIVGFIEKKAEKMPEAKVYK